MFPQKHAPLNNGRDSLSKPEKGYGARLIVLAYMAVAGTWILFTDYLMVELFKPMTVMRDWSIYKGYVFVAVTGLLLYVLISRMAERLKRVSESLRKSEARYRLLVENSPDGIFIHRDNRIVFANAPALQLFGAKDEAQLLGKSPFELLHPDCHENVRHRMDAIAQGRTVPLKTQKIVRLDGVVVEADVAPELFEDEEGMAIKLLFRDISERQQQEAEIRTLSRIYEVLSEVNHAVVRVTSRGELLQEVCRILCEVGEFKMAWIGWLDEAEREVTPVAWSGPGGETKHVIPICAVDDRPEGRGLVATAICEGRTCIANDYASDPRTQPWQENVVAFEHRSAISLPIRNGGKICGVLLVYSEETHCFQTKEVKLLEEVALDVSFDLDRMDQEVLRREAQEALKKSEEHLRLLVNHLHAGVVVHAPDSRIILSNPEATRLLGLSQEQMQGKGIIDPAWCFIDEKGKPMPPEDYPIAKVLATGQPLEGYVLGIKHGKEKTWVLANAYPEFDANGGLARAIVTFVDLTERKVALEALQESEEKFRTLFTASRDAIMLLDRTSYLDCNEATLEIFGCASKEEFCTRKLGEISAPMQANGKASSLEAQRMVKIAFKTGAARYEWMMQRFDGTQFPAEISLSALELKGRPVIQAVVRDISWRKEAEQQLRQLSRAVEQSPSSIVITDTQGNIQYINPKFTAISGYTSQEAIGQNPRILKSGEFPPEGYKALWETITSGREWHGEFHNKKKNGEFFWESASICPIIDESGAITHFLGIKEDITERKRTEEALRKSEEKFVKAFNTAPAVMAIITLSEARYVEVNGAFVEISGYSRAEVIGRTVLELNLLENPQDLERLVQMLVTQGNVRDEECRFRIKNGEVRVGLISAERIDVEGEPCVIYLSLDITERKQMEEKFLRAQRMESIGALAGGMAHDLNNILAPIMMSASMLSEKKLAAETRRQLISGIEEAAQRGANIVNQVLTFARGVKGQHAVLDTQVLATQIGQIVKETFPKSIVFSLSLPETPLWNITGDSTQLQQVLLNLCVNARDAMPNGGPLNLSVENYEVDSTFAFMVPEAKPGCYVRFRVADTGTGMDKAIVDRIFEPFFTTKEPGKGTGLGLSTVMGIVRSHGGFLKVETAPGKGSAFQVFLPATTDAASQAGEPDQPSVSRGHGETILIVDDEPEIVQIIATVLKQNGWTVLTAADGLEGVAAFLNYSGQIKALVTDMVMPNLDGLGLIRSIRKLAPDLPILVSSGYSNDQSWEALSELRVESFLKKPFSARQLIAEVVSLLYEKSANGK